MGSVLAVVVVVVAAKTFRVGRIKTWKIHVTKSVYLAHTQTTHTQAHTATSVHPHRQRHTRLLGYLVLCKCFLCSLTGKWVKVDGALGLSPLYRWNFLFD